MLEELYKNYKECLSKSDHKIFSYLLEHEQEIHAITAEDLSHTLGISTATISRFWSKIGFKNLKELKRALYKNQEATPFSRMNAALSQWHESGISPDMLLHRISVQTERTFQVVKPEQLDQAAHLTAANLPYGEQRRLEIARALATEPKLLLLDEPAAGMNPNETGELMDMIRFVRENFHMTILLIEHDMKLVSGICEKLTVLNFGEVLAQGATSDVLNDPQVITAYLGE